MRLRSLCLPRMRTFMFSMSSLPAMSRRRFVLMRAMWGFVSPCRNAAARMCRISVPEAVAHISMPQRCDENATASPNTLPRRELLHDLPPTAVGDDRLDAALQYDAR